jgi:cysteinyl-tRNA synthetase
MSVHLLGPHIDVHTGGIDLRFPHHEDERAQSNASVGHEVVNTWVHAEHLLFDGRKMSKSAGNVVLVGDVIGRGIDPLALRLAFLQHRYRQQMNLTWSVIEGAATTLARWRSRVAAWATAPSRPILDTWRDEFRSAIADDLDTPRALQVLHQAERDPGDEGAKFEFFAWADRVLGLDLARDVGRQVPDEIRTLLDERAGARDAKDWVRSDALRARILDLGFQVVDGPDGQTVQPR